MTDKELIKVFLNAADELHARGHKPPTVLFKHINAKLERERATGRTKASEGSE
jgi:hypothetical protein